MEITVSATEHHIQITGDYEDTREAPGRRVFIEFYDGTIVCLFRTAEGVKHLRPTDEESKILAHWEIVRHGNPPWECPLDPEHTSDVLFMRGRDLRVLEVRDIYRPASPLPEALEEVDNPYLVAYHLGQLARRPGSPGYFFHAPSQRDRVPTLILAAVHPELNESLREAITTTIRRWEARKKLRPVAGGACV